MSLINFSLKNPFTVLAVAVGLCLLGVAVAPSLPIDILPDFKKPVVVSFFSYPGLPTLDMEKSVTSRVERALTLAGGIEHQEARTVPGAAVIKVFFRPGTDPSAAMNDIVNLEASDMFHLPPGIEWPFTLRSEPANLPVVLAAIGGEGLSETELYNIGYYAVRNKMGSLPGVQIPHPFGGKFRQMMVYVDPNKLRAYNLSAEDVVDALGRSNLVLAAGSIKMGESEYQVHPTNTLPTPAEIDAVPIAVRDGATVFIRDVGYTKDDAALQYNIVRVNGSRSVYCPLLREPGQNTIEVVDSIYEGIAREIPKMKDLGDIPQATEVTLVADQSDYIRTAMKNLFWQVLLGAVLVTIVVALFLRSLMPTLAILAVLVLSILIGGLGFAFTGNSINVMTLGGIALAIGTVVDGGIVVVENVIRHLRMGKSPLDAARDGAGEVASPIFAGTITTLAVFIPAIFLTGMIQYLFTPLATAAGLTIAASYVVAITAVPALCATLLRRAKPAADAAGQGAPRRPGAYARTLGWALDRPLPVAVVIVALAALPLFTWPMLGSELFPEVDAGAFELRIKTAPGTRLEETEKLVIAVEEAIKRVIPAEEIKTIISNIGLPVGKGAGFSTVLSSNSGPDTAYLLVNLETSGRSVSTNDYIARLREALADQFPTDQFLFVNGSIVNMALNEGVPTPINVQVSAGSLDQCRDIAEQVVAKIKPIPGAADVQIGQTLDAPQIDINVDRVRAKLLGINQEDVARTALTSLGSSVGFAPTIWIDPASGTDYFMGVQYENNEVDSLDEVRNIPLSVGTEEDPTTIPLSNIAEVKRVTIPGEIQHYNIARVNDVYVNAVGRDVGSVARDVEAAIATMELPKGVSLTVRGPVQTMKEGADMLGAGLGVATVLVYLVLMAQFRSFTDPLIIMLAVPLGISGVLLVLWLTGTTLNIQSLMGTLMMIGVVVNSSILLVEFANVLRDRGMAPREAALESAKIRLRPILMTSLTLVASMAPLMFHWAPGNEAMVPLARALVGGLAVSTVLTLVLVPCVYVLIHQRRWATSP
ncbi:Cobalt-zinc-cadmium resistance protein CzcA [Pirellulimonas nuda]|uniref:Cobalt-zinc-cadmium resistance protein CzcA n=1 Tax=Pirellulimonas nuda TaxID=2528009 RepID=A0A518D8T1_9BACT|nr:efflux RND transporter permease subunit [Pirellulimonas nuda]QDU87889.1 Cobalt-zinc-cadmium resistance protein CzcA [Pirellulimonas nuda]